ncbi:MAG: IMP dehydrogenase [Candidatus Magasanikbacteria bacterium RIFCSPHIGHO2_01_FULL_41_23]|uniref:IMP dehydrogenase n=1 Tax=Candidatus Magasanikbacteria bacterium RIFCSPLOWO2_01_FULL_40_15 TaxID=1798686 RepID=A0A1F6N2B3_9BACT|nr:MAG: IMP dehydrogenase [Candidatus Magasanikbacteria bacterium RIFCSPHIGHO2_01_FULL_41_23]OGH66868.1 MAG: IMP dehydrogenase [Candidatus Magasanikbacteria bacterium RIFCSPHIGHO2_02_FULL_41_35]OGH74851.1 MAG: IMP dehydrogenase [Candidatus Magasanikbacteria bacterium RIFCSPHIGHO2_12_FULL_41_16]OGH78125.1 MAG: IMP dehydrogenase [Candidatus Magasanikbacteria bacterium RIFCSPLOWO2_01_FULL_40_15]
MNSIPIALTYDDVLIVPRRSGLNSRSEAVTTTRLTKKINLHIPLVSANMDTVTESQMAIALARLGGIGILHRFMTIEENIEEVKRVKRAQNFVVRDPYSIDPNKTIGQAKEFIAKCGVTGLVVANDDGRLHGILSRRDMMFAENDHALVSEIMTPRAKLIVGVPSTTFEEAKNIFAQNKIEKLPLVDEDNKIIGLITSDDIRLRIDYPLANTDEKGNLLVGASIGVKGDYIERAQELIKAGVDVLVIDIAHGHSDLMFDAIKNVRAACTDVQLIAGNIATSGAAQELCEAGVDGLKVGVGPGTICITRLVTGCGVPQLSAVMNVAATAQKYNVPVIADGGIQKSGDIVKAIGAGADTVMLGGSLAGTHESPGLIINRDGKKYKVCRGSASFAIAERRQKVGQEKKEMNEVTPEGVEAVVPYKGYLAEIVGQFIGGLKSGMSYTNSRTIGELQKNCDFVRITNAGLRESGPHDLQDVR